MLGLSSLDDLRRLNGSLVLSALTVVLVHIVASTWLCTNPKWWLFFPFAWPAQMFYSHTQKLRANRPPTPNYYPFFLFGLLFVTAALITWLDQWLLSELSSTSHHVAFGACVAGVAIYASQLARNVWLDFRSSQAVTAGYISLALFTGASSWWFYTAVQFSLAAVRPSSHHLLRMILAAGIAALYLVVVRRAPPALHSFSASTKMRLFVPKLVVAYVVVLAAFALAYWSASFVSPNAFCWSKGEAHISSIQPLSLEEAIYLAVMTQTTTGYGDITPCEHNVRWLAVMQVITGTMLPLIGFGYLISSFGEQAGRGE